MAHHTVTGDAPFGVFAKVGEGGKNKRDALSVGVMPADHCGIFP